MFSFALPVWSIDAVTLSREYKSAPARSAPSLHCVSPIFRFSPIVDTLSDMRLAPVLQVMILLPALLASASLPASSPSQPPFTDVSEAANAAFEHDVAMPYDTPEDVPTPVQMAGGVAAGDLDNDGDIDLYLVTGSAFPNRLLINDGSGNFSDQAGQWGVATTGEENTAPLFVDINSDGLLDLLVGGVLGTRLNVYRNTGQGRFEKLADAAGITLDNNLQTDSSIAAGDPDGDGDLDLYIGHWGASPTGGIPNHFWINTGQGQFVPGDELAGVGEIYAEQDWSFAPSFIDINGDGRQDLLVTSDFETSHTLINLDGIRFENRNVGVIDDKSGMGSAPADFDNDGDVDWFVSSIFYANPIPDHGNRLYRNDGEGNFTDATDEAGVRDGAWGWSACAADFNNDGWQDIFHVNGMWFINEREDFSEDRSRLFLNDGEAGFEEYDIAQAADLRQGRGVVCFDADLDGDIDIFSANVFGESSLYRNSVDPLERGNWLQIKLVGEANNPSAVGAIIRVTTGDMTQTREVTVGSNYQSQNPLMQHFGLADHQQVDQLEVIWPHGGKTLLQDLNANRRLVLSAQEATEAPLVIQAGMTAAWYDSERTGEGFLIEILPNDGAVMYWFTYDRDGNQDWYIAAGTVQGRRLVFPELLRVSGGEFGPGFDPDAVTTEVVGTAAFIFNDCDSGAMDWTLKPGLSETGFGRQQLTRLTRPTTLDCFSPGETPTPSIGPLPGNAILTGSYFDPSHNGEGYVIQGLGKRDVLVYWFTFDDLGNRRWMFGVGELDDEITGRVTLDSLLTSADGRFGEAFDPEQVVFPPWGQLMLDLNCDGGTASWEATEAGFPEDELALQRLTLPADVPCN